MEPGQPQSLLNRLLQGVIQKTPKGLKDLKFQDQEAFTGKPEDLASMIREAEICFAVQPNMYDTPTKKAYYVLSLFKKDNALLWKKQYLMAREGKTLCEGDTWEDFKNTLNKQLPRCWK